MKDWIDITAQTPKETENRRGKSDSETSTFQVSDLPVISLDIIRLLLSGIMLVFGLTRRERLIERERALRVRRAVMDVNRYVDTLWSNKEVYESWSGCPGPHWGQHMLKCWNYRRQTVREWDDPHTATIRDSGARIRSQKNNPHPEADTSQDVSGTRRTGIVGAGPSSPAALLIPP